MKRIKNSGFSLLEMVIAMVIIALVIAFSLALMGDGMRRVVKANELLTATALAQYEIDRVKNIAFPPTTDDRQGEYKKDKDDCPYDKNFQVEVVNVGYESDGTTVTAVNDDMVIRKITVDIYRKKDGVKMITLTTYISRNGAI